MELQEVEGIHAQVLQAPLDESREVLVVVAFRGVGIEASSGFGGDEDLLVRTVLEEASDQLLAPPVTVDVSRVEEVDPEVDRPVQGGVGVVFGDGPPLATQGPGAEADLRDAHPRLAKVPVLQGSVLSYFLPIQARCAG